MPQPPELGKICDECKKPCRPLTSPSRPDCSEYYCEGCHISYPMSLDAANYLLAMEASRKR